MAKDRGGDRQRHDGDPDEGRLLEERRGRASDPCVRCSFTKKMIMSTTAPARKPTVVALDHPSSLPRTSANTNRKRLAEKETKPIQSMRRVPRVLGLRDPGQGDEDGHHPDRHVDEEDPSPADGAGDGAADQRADRHGTADDAAVDAEGGAAVPALEGLRDEGERGGEHDGAPHPLHGARQVEHQRVGGEAADQRGHREDGQAAGEDLAPAVDVADDTGGEQEGGQRQGVGVDHPLQVAKSSSATSAGCRAAPRSRR